MDLNGITERKNVSLDNFTQNWKSTEKIPFVLAAALVLMLLL